MSPLCTSPQKKDTFEYCATEHIRVSGAYWGVMAMDLMHSTHLMKRDEIVAWLLECQHENGMRETNQHGHRR
jgi:geranylgeranyl transferase type-2 subunit beta